MLEQNPMLKRSLLLFMICLTLAACDALAEPTFTPSPTATDTLTPTSTVTPSVTPTATDTPTPTATPTNTPIPTDTPVPTATLTPVNTPFPTPQLSFDNWELTDMPASINNGLSGPRVAFINQNNTETIRNLSTAQPGTNTQILYFGSPTNPLDRIPVMEMSATTADRIYIAPRGNALAYFVDDPSSEVAGLYVLDLEVVAGMTGRILPVSSLSVRGLSNRPTWNPEGDTLALMIESGYSVNIMGFDVNRSIWNPLVESEAYDFWPVWSPDGRYLAFVSDRERCPTWVPGQPGACDADVDERPDGGHLHLLDVTTGEITRMSDEVTREPPRWINNRQIVFAGGDQFDLFDPTRTLWIATVADGTSREISLNDGSDTGFNLSDVWSTDGSRVVFQSVNDSGSEIVVMDASGNRIRTIDTLSFPRFSMRAAWSPDREHLALGGSGGQCPYGVRVLDANFSAVATGNPPPSMCSPIFSSDGRFIAFSGISSRTALSADGSVDIFTTNERGFDRVNLTGDLRGQMILLGWVEP